MPNTAASPPDLAPNPAKVYDALLRAGRPVTAYEIIDAVRPAGINAPPTVYRALSKLIDLGLVHRLESLKSFVACAHDHAHGDHHAGAVVFMICDGCGGTQEVLDGPLQRRLQETAAANDFHLSETTIELRGQCAGCGQGASAEHTE